MRLDDDIELLIVDSGYDENLDPVETKKFVSLGKCIILSNTAAKVVRTNDGKEYIYSYQIFVKKKKGLLIPKENDVIYIKKKDGTIDKKCTVVGFVTLKNWIKIWV